MRRASLFLAFALLTIIAIATLAWISREAVLAHFLSRQLHVPVTIGSLKLTKTSSSISDLWIGTPPKSKSHTSFTSKNLSVQTTIDQILGDPVIIDEIDIEDIFVGIELYGSNKENTNWNYILKEKKAPKSSKNYLIRTLILKNLTVEVMQPNGKTKRYPTIKKMEFHNISSDTGFPVDEIEKAIFNLMIQDIFQTLPIDQIFKTITPYLPIPFN